MVSATVPFNANAGRIRALYADLSGLCKTYKESEFGARHIQATRLYASRLIQELKQDADPVVAQFLLPKSGLPDTLNVAFNFSLMTCLLAMRNNLNETTIQQLVCAALSVIAEHQTQWQQYLQGREKSISCQASKRTRLALTKTGHHLWQSCLEISDYAGTRSWQQDTWPAKRPAHFQILYMSIALVLMVTPNRQVKQRSFFTALKQLCLACPDRWLNLLHGMTDYPGTLPPGSVVTENDGQGKHHFMVRRMHQDKVLATGFYQQSLESASASIHWPSSKQVHKTTPLKQLRRLDRWWDRHWYEFKAQQFSLVEASNPTFKITVPPASLLEIQDKVKKPNTKAGELAGLISNEPLLSQHILQSATDYSRLRLPATNVRQSLMMHGFERTVSILMQCALLHRLNQHDFPLRESFNKFIGLCAFLATSLIEKHKAYVPEQAGLLAVFSCSPLFTLPALKMTDVWEPVEQHHYDVCCLVNTQKPSLLAEQAHILAKAWHQSSQSLLAIQQQSTMPSQVSGRVRPLSTALGTAVALARQVMFPELKPCRQTAEYLRQAESVLDFDHRQLEDVRWQAAARVSMMCPI